MRLIRRRAVWNAIPFMRFDPKSAESHFQGDVQPDPPASPFHDQ